MEIDKINWYATTLKHCVKCGILFFGTNKGKSTDMYCLHPCKPKEEILNEQEEST